MPTATWADLEKQLYQRTFSTLTKARERSMTQLEHARQECAAFLSEHEQGFPLEDVCFVAVGSVGRLEALEASDLDIIPVLKDADAAGRFKALDRQLRERLQTQLKLKVSGGEQLTRCTDLGALIRSETIGGEEDDSSTLTRRILILTEGRQAGGELPINEVRQRLLDAYASAERTRGRHVLSLCNDVARYYRTLCIEYKAKVDSEGKDWCTRNVKLRHSRKFWYFATMLSIAGMAARHPRGTASYEAELLERLEQPPSLRLLAAAGGSCSELIAKIFDHFGWFLEFMADPERREALATISHAQRYEPALKNPFPTMKYNSDLMHQAMIEMVFRLPGDVRQRVMDWFLL